MICVFYFQRNQKGDLQEALGDRAVIRLDARRSMSSLHMDAVMCNGVRRPHYDAYQLFRGPNFLDAKPISKIILLPEEIDGTH